MKATRIAAVIMICIFLCACGNTVTGNTAASIVNKSETTVPTESNITAAEYKTIEELSGYTDVVSVTKVSYDLSELETTSLNAEQTAQVNALVNDTVTYEIIYHVDGFTVVGHISAPADYLTKNYPILVYNRGGNGDYGANTPESIGRLAYCFKYIIVATQYRETGIGTGCDRFGGEDVNDVMFLVNMTQTMAFANRNKVYMMGVSRGGMETCLAVRQDTKSIIKAAVSVSGVYDVANLYSFRKNMRVMLETRIIGSPSDVPDEYEKRSAVTFADQINIPILIIHSTRDTQAPYADAKKFAQLLDNYDKTYQFITRKDDKHGIENLNEINTIIKWFESVG